VGERTNKLCNGVQVSYDAVIYASSCDGLQEVASSLV